MAPYQSQTSQVAFLVPPKMGVGSKVADMNLKYLRIFAKNYLGLPTKEPMNKKGRVFHTGRGTGARDPLEL